MRPCGALERKAIESLQAWARDTLAGLGADPAGLQDMSAAKLDAAVVEANYPNAPLPVGCTLTYWNAAISGEISRDLVIGVSSQTDE